MKNLKCICSHAGMAPSGRVINQVKTTPWLAVMFGIWEVLDGRRLGVFTSESIKSAIIEFKNVDRVSKV